MRAAIYTRVSTDEQARVGLSMGMQEEECRRAALAAGAETLEVFADAGYTGTTRRRPALQDLCSRLSEFDVLYVWKLDRLSRSTRDFANLMHELAEHDVGFVSVTEAVDYTGSAGRLLLNMLAAVAAFFADLNRERVRAALRHRSVDQRLPHGKPPYGYTPADGGWEVDESQAQIVSDLFRRYAKGATLGELCRHLAQVDAPSSQGGRWHVSTVYKVLRNPAYIGRYRWHGEFLEGSHKPIISEHTWRAVQRRLDASDHLRPASRGGSLSPLLRCAECGAQMVRQGGRYDLSEARNRYHCSRLYLMPAEQRHPRTGGTMPKIHTAIWGMAEWLVTTDHLRNAMDAYAEQLTREMSGERAEGWRERLRTLDQELAANLRAYRSGAIPHHLLEEENRPLMAERETILAHLDATQLSTADRERMAALRKLDPATACQKVRRLSHEMQVAFLSTLFDHIEVGRNTLTFHLPFGVAPWEVKLPLQYHPQRGGMELPMPDGTMFRC